PPLFRRGGAPAAAAAAALADDAGPGRRSYVAARPPALPGAGGLFSPAWWLATAQRSAGVPQPEQHPRRSRERAEPPPPPSPPPPQETSVRAVSAAVGGRRVVYVPRRESVGEPLPLVPFGFDTAGPSGRPAGAFPSSSSSSSSSSDSSYSPSSFRGDDGDTHEGLWCAAEGGPAGETAAGPTAAAATLRRTQARAGGEPADAGLRPSTAVLTISPSRVHVAQAPRFQTEAAEAAESGAAGDLGDGDGNPGPADLALASGPLLAAASGDFSLDPEATPARALHLFELISAILDAATESVGSLAGAPPQEPSLGLPSQQAGRAPPPLPPPPHALSPDPPGLDLFSGRPLLSHSLSAAVAAAALANADEDRRRRSRDSAPVDRPGLGFGFRRVRRTVSRPDGFEWLASEQQAAAGREFSGSLGDRRGGEPGEEEGPDEPRTRRRTGERRGERREERWPSLLYDDPALRPYYGPAADDGEGGDGDTGYYQHPLWTYRFGGEPESLLGPRRRARAGDGVDLDDYYGGGGEEGPWPPPPLPPPQFDSDGTRQRSPFFFGTRAAAVHPPAASAATASVLDANGEPQAVPLSGSRSANMSVDVVRRIRSRELGAWFDLRSRFT
ncbi:MAG: hypothetical protein BJ554DRAFT_2860, partial [Olpidium bornovanus]